MHTKKKVSSRSTVRQLANNRSLRSQNKPPENAQVLETKAAEFITSSVRKSTCGGRGLGKRDGSTVTSLTTNLNARYGLWQDDSSNMYVDCNEDRNASKILQERNEGTTDTDSGTIFSPSFHSSNIEQDFTNSDYVDTNEVCLSSEASDIYLAMKNSKLECLDEQGQDSMMADISVEVEEECEELTDFDPYYFIKSLPALSSVVPTFRPMLLPKQTRRCPPNTLVLDLDETLVHSSLEPCDDSDFTFSVNFNQKEHTVYVRCRPYLHDFMERVAGLFEIIIFTASQSIYAEQLLNVLDPKRRIIRHRVFRESCVYVDGNYLKDLSVLGRDLSRVIIIDNSPQAFGFQVDNGIPIESWFDDRSDQELLSLIPFLERLAMVDDVRPPIAQKFNLRSKIAAAIYPPSNFGHAYIMDNLENVEDLAYMFTFDQQIPTMDNSNDVFTGVIEELLADKKQAVEKANSYQETVKKLIHLLGIAYKERDEANDKLRKLLLVKPYSPYSCKSQATTSHTQPSKQGASTSDASNFILDRKMDLQTTYNVSPLTSHTQPPKQGASTSDASNFTLDRNIDLQTTYNVGPLTSHTQLPKQGASTSNASNSTLDRNLDLQTTCNVGPLTSHTQPPKQGARTSYASNFTLDRNMDLQTTYNVGLLTSHTQPSKQGASISDASNFTLDRNMDLQTTYNVGPLTSHTQLPKQGASTSDANNFTLDRNMNLQTTYNVGPLTKASDDNALATLADSFIDIDPGFYMGSIDSMHNASSYLDSVNTSTLYNNIAIQRALPEKGKLVQSVQETGPLRETIMVASTSPQWQNPPQTSQHLRDVPSSTSRYFDITKMENGDEMKKSQQNLKHLGFVRATAINTLVWLSNVYDYAKQNSGPLRSAVGTVENAVTTVITPVFNKFKDVPDLLLVFLDGKVDAASAKFDEHAPPLVKQVVEKTTEVTKELVHHVQVGGPLEAARYAVKESQEAVLEQSVKIWSKLDQLPPFHTVAEVTVPTAAHFSEKYNKVISNLRGKGYTVFGYVPLVPIDEIAKAFKQAKAVNEGETRTAEVASQ
ncbi:uncharacterized protein LOC141641961 [Silene latifolia]|uniref:uncharacterized protein LOC141641961 n=1 Tax=Silene latifolia TaxID=37657 RepID=UPI003D778C08